MRGRKEGGKEGREGGKEGGELRQAATIGIPEDIALAKENGKGRREKQGRRGKGGK